MQQLSVILRLTKLAALAIPVVIIAGLSSLQTQDAIAVPSGEQTFKANCASCHSGGGNIVDPKKPVKGSAKLASEDIFKSFLLKPGGTMPASPQIANDAATLGALYNYCKTLK